MDYTDQEQDEIDPCIQCGKDTNYKKRDHIDTRIGYIEGAGQLCPRCHYNDTFIKKMHY